MRKAVGIAVLLTALMAPVPLAVAASQAPVDADLEAVLAREWETTHQIDGLHPEVKSELLKRFGEDKRLAAPGEPFNATDVIDGRPSRRLLLAGRSGTMQFVAYERGGRGHHVVLVVFDTARRHPEIRLLARGSPGKHNDIRGWRLSLEDLRTAAKLGSLTVDDANEAYF